MQHALEIADSDYDWHRGPERIARYVIWDHVGAEIEEAIEIDDTEV